MTAYVVSLYFVEVFFAEIFLTFFLVIIVFDIHILVVDQVISKTTQNMSAFWFIYEKNDI